MKQILRRLLVLLPALGFSLLLSYWLFRVELAEAVSLPEPEVIEEPAIDLSAAAESPIFSVSDTEEITICWEGAPDSHRLRAELSEAVDAILDEGAELRFLLFDLNSGNGISYNSTEGLYCASTIKGPYAACIAETLPVCIDRSAAVMEETIQVSDNDGYRALRRTYGSKTFLTWTEEAGCEYLNPSALWPEITAHDLALMWTKMYVYFTSDTEDAAWTADLYVDTLNSFLSEELGDICTVYSKAGWIDSGGYYTARNDAGIVMKEDHPYVLVVLSDAYGEDALLQELVHTLDTVHTWLVEHD